MNKILYSETSTREFIDRLKLSLAGKLPGVDAHVRLAPMVRIEELKTGFMPLNAQNGAVLILLYPVENRLQTVVILRNEYDGAHSGQISFPGGKSEDGDLDFAFTALRETREEIGIATENLELIGQLSDFYVRPSNFIVYPFVAFAKERPEFHPDTVEVQRIIEIDFFKDITYEKIEIRTLNFKNGLSIQAPGFAVGGEFMWGATAMIISELITILNSVIVEEGRR